MMALSPNQSADARPAALNWDLAALLAEVSADDAGGDEEVAKMEARRRRAAARQTPPPGAGDVAGGTAAEAVARGQTPRRRPTAEDSLEALRASCLMFEDLYAQRLCRLDENDDEEEEDGVAARTTSAPAVDVAPPPASQRAYRRASTTPREEVAPRPPLPRPRAKARQRRSTVCVLEKPAALLHGRGRGPFDAPLDEFRYFLNHDQISFPGPTGPDAAAGAKPRRRARSACARYAKGRRTTT